MINFNYFYIYVNKKYILALKKYLKQCFLLLNFIYKTNKSKNQKIPNLIKKNLVEISHGNFHSRPNPCRTLAPSFMHLFRHPPLKFLSCSAIQVSLPFH